MRKGSHYLNGGFPFAYVSFVYLFAALILLIQYSMDSLQWGISISNTFLIFVLSRTE